MAKNVLIGRNDSQGNPMRGIRLVWEPIFGAVRRTVRFGSLPGVLLLAGSLVGVLFLAGGCSRSGPLSEKELVLNGNVDDRQANLAFLISERVAEIRVEEGTFVKKGDLVGTLETVRIQNQVAEAEAMVLGARASVKACEATVASAQAAESAGTAGVAAAQASFEKTMNGNREEDVAMAEAGVLMIEAQLKAAGNLFERNKKLSQGIRAVSEQEADDAESNFRKLLAEQTLASRNLDRMRNGSRQEEKDLAQAQLEQAKAQLEQAKAARLQAEAQLEQAQAALVQAEAALTIQKQRLTDCQLFAPCDGIIRNRILEPGEMASPQLSALTLAIVSPKWVRVYLNETRLPMIRSGDEAKIQVDGSERTFRGWVGFISPTAEFTPKNVETPELRTSLVYEVRVFVEDPENFLKLGAPATVTFPQKAALK